MTKAPATKTPEAARAAALEAGPRAHRQGADDGRVIADEALRRVLGTHQATLSETSKRLAQRLA